MLQQRAKFTKQTKQNTYHLRVLKKTYKCWKYFIYSRANSTVWQNNAAYFVLYATILLENHRRLQHTEHSPNGRCEWLTFEFRENDCKKSSTLHIILNHFNWDLLNLIVAIITFNIYHHSSLLKKFSQLSLFSVDFIQSVSLRFLIRNQSEDTHWHSWVYLSLNFISLKWKNTHTHFPIYKQYQFDEQSMDEMAKRVTLIHLINQTNKIIIIFVAHWWRLMVFYVCLRVRNSVFWCLYWTSTINYIFKIHHLHKWCAFNRIACDLKWSGKFDIILEF